MVTGCWLVAREVELVSTGAILAETFVALTVAGVPCETNASCTGSPAPPEPRPMNSVASVKVTTNLGLPAHNLARRKENLTETFPDLSALLVALRSADDTNVAFCTREIQHWTYHQVFPGAAPGGEHQAQQVTSG